MSKIEPRAESWAESRAVSRAVSRRGWSWLGALALAGVVAGVTAGSASSAGEAWVPPDDTIVKITGNKADGFGIHLYDGTALFPPTDSEALAECGEYDTRVARVRCRTEVRVWYRDLGQMKRALRLARLTAGD